MRQFGFKNFRKFADFPTMELAPITIFVGENNAGKSTVIKGILALNDFLKSTIYFEPIYEETQERQNANLKVLENIKFFFNTNYLAHIGTFKRSLYNRADDNSITFQTKVNNSDISFVIKGDPKDEEAVSGTVTDIIIFVDDIRMSFHFNLAEDKAIVTFNPNPDFKSENCNNSIKDYEKYFSSFNTPISFEINISSYLNGYKHGWLLLSLIDSVTNAMNVTIYQLLSEKNELLDETKREDELRFFTQILNISSSDLKPIEGISSEIADFFISLSNNPDFSYTINTDNGNKFSLIRFPRIFYDPRANIEYLYAHTVTQTVIYSAKDTNDYLSMTIHEFASQKEQQYKHDFITKWMKVFFIGNDYEILSVGGEAHIVYIVNTDGEKVWLADKGMGSIQLMVLLFRLAISLPDEENLSDHPNNGVGKIERNEIFIIEEPEQNLHPSLQSKLADLFFELNSKYGFNFIIETHSEYLIRKTQVIVKEIFNDKKRPLKENPFKVFYFNSSDSEKPYYEIIYQKDGCFSNDFGKGFFDEASNLAFEIL